MQRDEAAQSRVHHCAVTRGAVRSTDAGRPPLAVILGVAGERLSPDERRFFAAFRPARLCAVPAQLRRAASRSARWWRSCARRWGAEDAPVLIDQEGGRVARLRPPQWRAYPAAAEIAAPARAACARSGEPGGPADRRRSRRTRHHRRCRAGSRPAGARRRSGYRRPRLGHRPGPRRGAGRAVCEGLLDGGVLPIIKHIPGHGRARVDSHKALPRVDDAPAVLRRRISRRSARWPECPGR